ncbi:MAG: transglycosylase SLT domain-containing protein [Bacteroidales bacterium]|jgi:membrane-bound lytic murein transglycosylase F|nr:transglycosylase SLT domain-containing protein [Bacteroidales bacterium]
MKSKQYLRSFLFALLPAAFCVFLLLNKPLQKPPPAFNDWKTIQGKGEISVGVLQNGIDYHLINGKVYGFHYKMAENVANMLNLEIKYLAFPTYWDAFYSLLSGEIDLLAMDLGNDAQSEVFLDLTTPVSFSSYVLVQNKDNLLLNNNLQSVQPIKDSSFSIKVPQLSAYYEQALWLMSKTNMVLDLQTSPSASVIDYLNYISENQSVVTILDKKIMLTCSSLYPTLDYSVELSEELPFCWAVSQGNKTLLKVINNALGKLKSKPQYGYLLKEYYTAGGSNSKRLSRNSRKIPNGYISPYDDLFKRYGQQYGIDWRLAVAIACRESAFNPHALGKYDAFGLMQFLPSTAQHLGMKNFNSIDNQVKTGCKYLKILKDKFLKMGVDSADIEKFILTAYNAGACHVEDAIRLTKAEGNNYRQWSEVEKSMLHLADIKHTYKVRLKCGLYRGNQSVKYSKEVYTLYLHYKNLF